MKKNPKTLLKDPERGSIFILVLWVITILAFLSIGLAAAARQKALVYQRLASREELRGISGSAAKKIMADLEVAADPQKNKGKKIFEEKISLSWEKGSSESLVEDEGGCININTANAQTLQLLLESAAGLEGERARALAYRILDFRDEDDFISAVYDGGSEKGSYQSSGLDYGPKNAPFEVPEELLQVRGMTKDIYGLIQNYITIYGNSRININTCSAQVLQILDLSPELIAKIMAYRKGIDGAGGTGDDRRFSDVSKIEAVLAAEFSLTENEHLLIRHAVTQGELGVTSKYFRISTKSWLNHTAFSSRAVCVYGLGEGIKYWAES